MEPKELIAHVREAYGAEPEYLWADSPDAFVFRHRKNRKWFGVVMEVERSKLGLEGAGRVALLDGSAPAATVRELTDLSFSLTE